MTTDIEDYCHRCVRCALAKEGKECRTTMGSLQAKRPLDVVAMDFTVLEPGTNRVENVLILTRFNKIAIQGTPQMAVD